MAVERAARAIAAQAFETHNRRDGSLKRYESPEAYADAHWQVYKREARAAVEAIREPTEAMWGGLARAIVFWARWPQHDGASLYKHLRSLGIPIPEWMLAEIPDVDVVPPKGTVAAVIWKAMIDAALKE